MEIKHLEEIKTIGSLEKFRFREMFILFFWFEKRRDFKSVS
jgi:hypothetical protein